MDNAPQALVDGNSSPWAYGSGELISHKLVNLTNNWDVQSGLRNFSSIQKFVKIQGYYTVI